MHSPALKLDWTINIGQIVTAGWVTILAAFLAGKIVFIFREFPSHKHVTSEGKLSRVTRHGQTIQYPAGAIHRGEAD
jgi:hypothetical protein